MTTVPFELLRPGHHPEAPAGVANVRQIGRDAGLDALAASIGAIGLLQPLVVVAGAGGYRYVVDGNRRLAAIERLIEKGVLPADSETEVVERDAHVAREAGLAANITQETMHEADKVEAFAQLAAAGRKPKEIAAHFGTSVPQVKKLLALGGVAPVILDAWRSAKIDIDTVKAFTLAPSTDVQERAFAKLSKAGNVYAYVVREELGAGHSTASLLKKVGIEAFKAAGGKVVADLFGDTTAVSDPELLRRLADERLIARRDELRADGWSWVEIASDLPPNASYSWRTLNQGRREPTEAEAARLREIEAILDAEDDDTVSDEQVKALHDEHMGIEKAMILVPGAEDRARSGCIVDWGWNGEMQVREYVLRPEDVKVAAPEGGDSAAEPDAKGLSSALVDRLATQMTEAVQDAFAVSPWTAVAALLAGVSCTNPWQSPFRMRCEGLNAAGEHARANERFEALFERYSAMPMNDLLEATGRILARGLDLRTRTPGSGDTAGSPADSRAIQLLAGSIDADVLTSRMHDRWDAQGFFSSAPKAVALAAIEEACGAEAAARAGKLKKKQIVELAVTTVVPTGWLPREIRWSGYAGPGGEVPVQAAA